MISLTFPSASYGRSTESPEPEVDQYQVLFQSEDFPVRARKALEQLVASVQWAGGGPTNRYDDCFAMWPVDQYSEGALVARLTDGGHDRLGRPHALRVDAVYVDSSEVTNSPAQLASLLSPAAWPDEPWTGHTQGINLNFDETEGAVTAALKQALSERGLPRVFIAHHSNFRAQGFDLIFDPEAPAGRSCAASVSSELPPPREQIAGSPLAYPSEMRQFPIIWIALAVMTLGFFGASWWGYDRYKQLQGNCSGLQRQLNGVQRMLDSETSAHHETAAKLEELEKNLEPLRRNVVELTTRLDNAYREIEQKQDKLPAKSWIIPFQPPDR